MFTTSPRWTMNNGSAMGLSPQGNPAAPSPTSCCDWNSQCPINNQWFRKVFTASTQETGNLKIGLLMGDQWRAYCPDMYILQMFWHWSTLMNNSKGGLDDSKNAKGHFTAIRNVSGNWVVQEHALLWGIFSLQTPSHPCFYTIFCWS